jgi:hypothetical protein
VWRNDHGNDRRHFLGPVLVGPPEDGHPAAEMPGRGRCARWSSALVCGTRLGIGPQVCSASRATPAAAAAIVPFPAAADSWFSYSRVLPLLPAPYHAYAQDQCGRGDSGHPACCGVDDSSPSDQMRRGDGSSWSRLLLDDLVQQPPQEPPQASREVTARQC